MSRWFNNCMANMSFLAQVRLRNATYGWCLYGAFISGKGKIGGGSGGGIDSSEERAVSAGTRDKVAAGFWDKIAAAVWDEVVAAEREMVFGELRSGAYEGGLGVEGGARVGGIGQE